MKWVINIPHLATGQPGYLTNRRILLWRILGREAFLLEARYSLESLITRYYRFPWTFRRNCKNLGSLAVICSGSQFPSFSNWSHSSQWRWTSGFSGLTKDIKETKCISNANELTTVYKCCSNTHINWSHLSTEIITDCNSTIPHGQASDELSPFIQIFFNNVNPTIHFLLPKFYFYLVPNLTQLSQMSWHYY